MKVTDNIKAIRKSKGITQIEIAEKLGIGQSNYTYLENRGEKLTIEQIEAIAGALGVSVMELLTGEPQTGQDSERVKELEKDINDLERGIEDFSIHTQIYLDSLLISCAIENRVGKLNLYTDGGNKVELIELQQIPKELDLNNWLETNYPNSYHAEDINMTYEEEKELVRKIIAKNKGLADILIIIRRLIKDDAWIEVLTERIERKNKSYQRATTKSAHT